MIIDVHAHAFPDRVAPKAMRILSEGAGLSLPETGGTIASLLASMADAGIDASWVASIATRPEQSSAILDWSLRIRSPKIVPLGSIHPSSPHWRDELAAIRESGLPGVKLHPQYQGFVADEPRMMPVYREIARLGLFLLVHAGYDIAFRGDTSAAPSRFCRVHAEVPELDLVLAHLGGWQAWDEVIDTLVGTAVYLDTSYSHEIGSTQRGEILTRHDPTRLLFGTDHPWITQGTALNGVRSLSLKNGGMELLLGGNAQRLAQSRAVAPSPPRRSS